MNNQSNVCEHNLAGVDCTCVYIAMDVSTGRKSDDFSDLKLTCYTCGAVNDHSSATCKSELIRTRGIADPPVCGLHGSQWVDGCHNCDVARPESEPVRDGSILHPVLDSKDVCRCEIGKAHYQVVDPTPVTNLDSILQTYAWVNETELGEDKFSGDFDIEAAKLAIESLITEARLEEVDLLTDSNIRKIISNRGILHWVKLRTAELKGTIEQ